MKQAIEEIEEETPSVDKLLDDEEDNPSVKDLTGEQQIVYSFCLWYNIFRQQIDRKKGRYYDS